jgi:hypothetical protein
MRKPAVANRCGGRLLVLLMLGCASAASARDFDDDAGPGWRPFASVTPWTQGGADLEAGGDFRASGTILRAGVSGPAGDGGRSGLTLSYDRTDYRFSAPAAFGGTAPWDDVRHIGLSVPLWFPGSNEWSFLVNPSIDSFMEDGAKTSESIVYGAVLAVVKRFGPDRRLGLGVGVFDQLEEVKAHPVILVDWAFTDRLRLGNPLAAGPTGGAGLELTYRLDSGWELGGGGARRVTRFRLDEAGPFPNGVGEQRGYPVFAHVGRRFDRAFRLDVYAGATFGGELRVDNASGNELIRQDFDAAPLVGVTLTARF